MKLKMKIAHLEKQICYPKDFPRPKKKPYVKHIAFIDPKLFIIDKSREAKIRLKQKYSYQVHYLD